MEQIFLIEAIGAALLGAILGSFINALVFRYGTGFSIMRGRSRCMRCGHTLTPLDLVPVVSFLFLGGACRWCGARISVQYPLVEVAGALLSLALLLSSSSLPIFVLGSLFWMTLLFAIVYDLRHLSLPIPALWIVGLSGLAATFLTCSGGVCQAAMPPLLSLAAGPVVAAPLLLFSAVSRGRWMGWGDGFLTLGLGWYVGLTAGFTALCFAFWGGAVIGLALIVVSKWRAQKASAVPMRAEAAGFTMISEIPFAPFLVFGTAAVYFLHVDLFSVLLI